MKKQSIFQILALIAIIAIVVMVISWQIPTQVEPTYTPLQQKELPVNTDQGKG